VVEYKTVSDLTYTLPVGNTGIWFAGDTRPEVITGQLVFCAHKYENTDGTLDRWIHARFYFDSKLWDVDEHGYIYTDDTFLQALHNRLRFRGWIDPERSITYSESGMQGVDYVDFDVMSSENNTLLNLLVSKTIMHDKWPVTSNTQVPA
jgi:hypothetical protein